MNKIITIIGGTGFVGRYVVKLLAGQGYQIRVIARDVESALHLKTAGDVGQVVLVSGDITKPESLKGKLDHSFAVINLAGILFETWKQKFSAVHEKGPGKLAELAKKAGVERFIQISALGISEVGNSKYASSKLIGEKAVKGVFPDATILRPGIIFGAEDRFFNKFATMASVLPFLPLIGGGKTRFQPVYVVDVAQAILAAVEKDNVKGKTFELGGPRVYSFRDLLDFICKTIRRNPLRISISFCVARVISCITQLLPCPPLTSDQVRLLEHDNVVSANAKILADLGITAQSVENIVPLYLARFVKKIG